MILPFRRRNLSAHHLLLLETKLCSVSPCWDGRDFPVPSLSPHSPGPAADLCSVSGSGSDSGAFARLPQQFRVVVSSEGGCGRRAGLGAWTALQQVTSRTPVPPRDTHCNHLPMPSGGSLRQRIPEWLWALGVSRSPSDSKLDTLVCTWPLEVIRILGDFCLTFWGGHLCQDCYVLRKVRKIVSHVPSGESIFGYLVHVVAVNSLMDSKIMFLWVSWPFFFVRVERNVLCDFLRALCKWNSCYLNVYYAQDAAPSHVYWLCTVTHPVWRVSLKGGNLFGHLFLWKSDVLDSSTVFGLMKPIPVLPLAFWVPLAWEGQRTHLSGHPGAEWCRQRGSGVLSEPLTP